MVKLSGLVIFKGSEAEEEKVGWVKVDDLEAVNIHL